MIWEILGYTEITFFFITEESVSSFNRFLKKSTTKFGHNQK